MATPPYKRLPGSGRSLMNYTTLWEAGDHLLMVHSHIVSEAYRRLFYRDIQAIVLCKTAKRLVLNIIFGALAAIFALPVFFADGWVAIVFGAIAATFLVLIVLNSAWGPTCKCTLRTAVQTQPMPSLGRLRSARKAIAIIQQRVEAVQQETSTP